MVKVEANSTMKGEDRGTELTVEMEGSGIQISNEILSIIQGLMSDLKEHDRFLHAMCLQAIADNPRILLGKKDEDEELRESMAMKMSKTTDRSVID